MWVAGRLFKITGAGVSPHGSIVPLESDDESERDSEGNIEEEDNFAEFTSAEDLHFTLERGIPLHFFLSFLSTI